jgi:UDPglucose 6-dehydrogenase
VKVCVQGLWHLGTVIAACLAERGHQVVGLDHDGATVDRLRAGLVPVQEPGLQELVQRGLATGALSFTTELAAAGDVEVVWVAYDTPVDAEDRADVDFVVAQVERLFPVLRSGTLVLVSSQLPVGTVARLETAFAAARPGVGVRFACSPENLRLGKALPTFLEPDRLVVGAPDDAARAQLTALLVPLTDRIEWMSVESAEMVKHALNAFLAVSVSFANEIASICEQVGADAKEVERGLKSDARIGPRAYLAPGAAFAGGTLARDVEFLGGLGRAHALELALVGAVRASNEWHKGWTRRCLEARLGRLQGATIAVWGLTYKPGTDTLRRSSAVELCLWLAGQGASVRAHDPAIRALAPELAARISLLARPEEALVGAAALVLATEWPEFRTIDLAAPLATMAQRVIVDPGRFLADRIAGLEVDYYAVGVPRTGGEKHG